MVRKVTVNFNVDNGPGVRASEHVSFQYYVPTLGDVPVVGDYVDMLTWNHERECFGRQPVRVTARRIMVSEPNEGDRYEPGDEVSMIVTLMVERTSKKDGMPDFRG